MTVELPLHIATTTNEVLTGLRIRDQTPTETDPAFAWPVVREGTLRTTYSDLFDTIEYEVTDEPLAGQTFTFERVHPAEYETMLKAPRLVRRMRAAGVPVIGHLWPVGVTRGVLRQRFDPLFDEYTFSWSEE